MGFSAGARLGAYEILAPLGAGGMGEVWQAHDTRLGRDVALKVLPEVFAEDPERMARFRREAHLLASLNHPSIAAIYGLEEADGKTFLALELVRGEDLTAPLSRGPIPVAEAIGIARQIVDALEEAHAKGIVHRDLKPGNVKLTPEGKAKVLDFGLAKAYADDRIASTSATDVSRSPTLARSGTLAGAILGTAPYMSPEQASGKPLDRRTDIWSFGVVLFEMLTGRPLFTGDTTSEVLASVIKDEPLWARLPADCPVAIVRLLRRCLRKHPRERLQDIGDARLELEAVREEDDSAAAGGTVRPDLAASRRRERWAWACAFGAVAIAAVVGARHLTQAREAGMPVRFVLDMPEGITLDPTAANLPAVSPDGRSIAFGHPSSSLARSPLFVRSLVSGETQALPGTEGGSLPFWSPDGASVAFFARGSIARVDVKGGPPRRVCPVSGLMSGGTWNRQGTILFSAGIPGTIYSVPGTGGEAVPLLPPDVKRGETGHRWPQFLPDGEQFLFSVRSSQPEHSGLFVASLAATDERRRLVADWSRGAATGEELLFSRGRTLFGQTFDAARSSLRGEATPIARDLAVPASTFYAGWAWFATSPNGTLVYVTAGGSDTVQLAWVDRHGSRLHDVGRPAAYGQVALAPDEK
ncbi:MAG TPA: protein kinase, partial [Vicinamibacteria bacterium]